MDSNGGGNFKKYFKFKKRWFILAIVIVILLLAFLFIRLKYVSPITYIQGYSHKSNEVKITWYDDNDSNDNTNNTLEQVYVVYLSNKPGIKINNPSTYTHNYIVSGCELKFNTNYNVVYFRVTKSGFTSPEFETLVYKDQNFILNNLQPILFCDKNDGYIHINVRVLQNAELYHVYYMTENEEMKKIMVQDFDVYNQDRIDLKLNKTNNDTIYYISYEKNNIESEPIFLLYNDKEVLGQSTKITS